MVNIAAYRKLIAECAEGGVRLVAVSKSRPAAQLLDLYQEGQRIFGENRTAELAEKASALPADIQWHVIGHLQKNKVKQIIRSVDLIHSVDSFSLLEEINKQAFNCKRTVNCLFQVKISSDAAKQGFDYEELLKILQHDQFSGLLNIRILGLMGMASLTQDQELIKKEFRLLKNYFHQLKSEYFSSQESFRELSMGMSTDYKLALAEGSTMLRIGSLIFQN